LISLALACPAGAALALARFSRPRSRGERVNTGMGLPPVVVGLFVTLLLWRGGPFGDLEILYTPAAIVVAQAVIAAPIVTGITLAAVGQVPREFRLQLLALGASRAADGVAGAARGAPCRCSRPSCPDSAGSSRRSGPPYGRR